MEIALVAAVARGGVIGRGLELPWRLPRDMRHFRALTMGHALLMGRRTWESIGEPLPGRSTVVVSSNAALPVPDEVIVVRSLADAVDAARARGASKAFVAGGAALYREGLGCAHRLHLTRVLAEVEGDVVAPDLETDALEAAGWKRVAADAHPSDERHEHPFVFEEWVRSEADA